MSEYAHAGIQIDLLGDAIAELKALRGEFDTLKKSVGGIETQAEKTTNAVKGLSILKFDALANSLQGLGGVFGAIGNKGMEFQDQVAELSAITGIAGKDLDALAISARETGKETGLGAAASAEAYKLLASNIDIATIGGVSGLKNLQEETILLSQAAKLEMPKAAETMTAAINQFGLKGEDANRVTNVLAASSKYGAAEVANLAETLKYVGPVAGAAKLSIESTAGAIEVLSQSNIKGSQAGTDLTQILTMMQSRLGVDFTKTSLPQVLEQLKPKLNDVKFLTEKFGVGQLASVQVLIKNAEAVQEMTKKVGEHGVAEEQARINTATYSTEMKRLKAQFDDVKISIFEHTGALMPMGEMLVGALGTISQVTPALKLMGDGFKSVSTLMQGATTAAEGVAGAAQGASSGMMGIGLAAAGAISSLVLFNALLKEQDELEIALKEQAKEKAARPMTQERQYIDAEAQRRINDGDRGYTDINTAKRKVAEEEEGILKAEIEKLKSVANASYVNDPTDKRTAVDKMAEFTANKEEAQKKIKDDLLAITVLGDYKYLQPKKDATTDPSALITGGAKINMNEKNSGGGGNGGGSGGGSKNITNNINHLIGSVTIHVTKVDDGIKQTAELTKQTLLAELNDMEKAL